MVPSDPEEDNLDEPLEEEQQEVSSEPETFSDRLARNSPWWAISVGFHVLLILVAAFWVVATLAQDDPTPIVAAVQPPPEPPKIEEEKIEQKEYSNKTLDIPQRAEDAVTYEAKESDHNESADNEEFHERKGESKDFVSDKPFKGYGTYDTIGGGSGGGGRYGGRLGGKEDLVARGGGNKNTENAVLEALKWLSRHQHDDGSWSVKGYISECGGKKTSNPAKYSGQCSPNPGDDEHNAGVSGLSLLAFLGAGYFHSSRQTYDGIRFGDVVRKSLEWMMKNQDAEGCIGGRSGTEYMYDHLICALSMSEAYGLSQSTLFKDAAQKAVDFTVAAQNDGRGWRYKFKSGENDSSVTGWAVMVLKSGDLSGLTFPHDTAYGGAKAWYDEVTRDDGYSSVGYYSKEQGKVRIPGVNENFEDHPAMTAVATMARIFMDKQKNQKIDQGIKVIAQDLPKADANSVDFYYWYYASLAMFQYDGPGGPMWKKWNEPMKNILVKSQNVSADDKKGSWEPTDRWGGVGGRVYATAINALTLEVYYRYASVFGSRDVKNPQ